MSSHRGPQCPSYVLHNNGYNRRKRGRSVIVLHVFFSNIGCNKRKRDVDLSFLLQPMLQKTNTQRPSHPPPPLPPIVTTVVKKNTKGNISPPLFPHIIANATKINT
jgi:hypothetical protein